MPKRLIQDEWVRIIRERSITDRKFWRECTPGYYNNEGHGKAFCWIGADRCGQSNPRQTGRKVPELNPKGPAVEDNAIAANMW